MNTQTQPTAQPLHNFAAVMWEKAEHWEFDLIIKAPTIEAARAQLAKDYPARSYRIKSLRSVYTPTEPDSQNQLA